MSFGPEVDLEVDPGCDADDVGNCGFLLKFNDNTSLEDVTMSVDNSPHG
jgi:hypothetical protein